MATASHSRPQSSRPWTTVTIPKRATNLHCPPPPSPNLHNLSHSLPRATSVMYSRFSHHRTTSHKGSPLPAGPQRGRPAGTQGADPHLPPPAHWPRPQPHTSVHSGTFHTSVLCSPPPPVRNPLSSLFSYLSLRTTSSSQALWLLRHPEMSLNMSVHMSHPPVSCPSPQPTLSPLVPLSRIYVFTPWFPQPSFRKIFGSSI